MTKDELAPGKIVDCLLDQVEAPLWQAAILALTRELAQEGADVAQCYASTPWMSEALSSCGFVSRFGVKFHIRDPQGLIPREGDLSSHDTRRRLRVHVKLRGISNKREYLARTLERLGAIRAARASGGHAQAGTRRTDLSPDC